MHTKFLLMLFVIVTLVLFSPGVALAHGQPVITVDPVIAPAGGQITVRGSEVEPSEVFAITLEGMSGTLALGQATVTGAGEEGEFTATLTIPANLAPGSYLVRASTKTGEAATADLTVTASAANASAGPAMVMDKASGAPHVINRTRSIVETLAVAVAIAICGGLGLWFVRKGEVAHAAEKFTL